MRRILSLLTVIALTVFVGCDSVDVLDQSVSTTDNGGSSEVGLGKGGSALPQFAGNGNYYLAVSDPGITWSDARDAAAAMETYRGCVPHLATIATDDENTFIVDAYPTASTDGYWLGGYQPPGSTEPDGGWAWITGEPFLYSNWEGGEPNDAGDENALHFAGPFYGGTLYTWNDQNENNSGPIGGYVVEFDCGSKVTGSGHLTDTRFPEPDYRTFSFTAIRKPDGSVNGQWQLNNRALEVRIHGSVECVVVVGNEAWFAGTATQSSDPALIGVARGFRVVDNGEGTAPPDQLSFSPTIADAQEWCTSGPDTSLNDVENGNVQIH